MIYDLYLRKHATGVGNNDSRNSTKTVEHFVHFAATNVEILV